MDLNHCSFREDDGDNIEASDWDDPITDLDKRKVVQYIAFVDDFDGESRFPCPSFEDSHIVKGLVLVNLATSFDRPQQYFCA